MVMLSLTTLLHAGAAPTVQGVDLTFVMLAAFWLGVLALVMIRQHANGEDQARRARTKTARKSNRFGHP